MTSYADASSETSQNNNDDDNNTKRNRKTQALSALLSATALGVFLEGCGGEDVPPPTPPPTPAVLGSASNPFVGTAEADTFPGEEGLDWVSYAGATPNGVLVDLLGAPENNLGWALGDTLTGIRNIIGTPQGDTLIGDDNPNIFRGGLGGDTINGNEGTDTVSYSSSSKGVRVDLSSAVAQLDFTTEAGFAENQNEAVGDTLSNIENIEGSAHADWLMGDGGNNIIRGGGGGDTISGGVGADTLYGGAGADTYIFRVGDGTDIITDALGDTMTLRFIGDYAATDFAADRTGGPLFAIEGNNLVFTFVKDDITDKVTIEDAYGTGVALRYTINVEYGTAADSSLTKIAAADGYWSGLEAPTGDGSESNPFLATEVADTTIVGKAGADWVSYVDSPDAAVKVDLATPTDNTGWAAGDTLTGIQNIIGTNHGDILYGNGDANILRGNAGGDDLKGEGGDDTIYGGAGLDNIRGGAGNDIIFAGAGNDYTIYGDAGDDTLDGGKGDDEVLSGGAGTDTYIFRVGDSSGTNGDTLAYDVPGDTTILRFIGDYEEGDFTEASANFDRVGNNLVITLDTDKITILNAYDAVASTGTGNSAFTINVEYGIEGSDSFSEVTLANSYWHNLAAT